MAHYARHGHEPTDDEIADYGLRAFAPRRDPYNPEKADWQRALRDCATGDADELAKLGEEVAGWWPGWFGWPGAYWGYLGFDDD